MATSGRIGFFALLLALAVGACGGSSTQLRATGAGHDGDMVFVGNVPVAPKPPTIRRDDLERVVDQGLGRFLQRLEVDPVHVGGSFVGFRITNFFDLKLAAGDIHTGDIVTRVNDLPIGLPEEALEVWDTVRDADEIVITYLRGDQRSELRIAVVD